MRQVTKSAWVDAFVERTCKEIPSFRVVFEEGIMWQLKRKPLDDAVVLDGSDPKTFVLQTTAWAAEGIPPITMAYVETVGGIEIVRLALHKKLAKNSN